LAIIGSANLTRGGFQTNVELIAHLRATEASQALDTLTIAATPRSVEITCEELRRWVAKYAPVVESAKTTLKNRWSELDENQQEGDELLGVSTKVIVEPTDETLDQFVTWLRAHSTLPGASYLFDLHKDKIVQRRQGHVKQCFAGVFRFIQEYPSWIQHLQTAVTDAKGMLNPSSHLLVDWTAHLQRHATATNRLYSYTTLRKELRPNLGGILKSPGGGASGTLKRMFSVVARFVATHPVFLSPPKRG
jgi:hypothetical protein